MSSGHIDNITVTCHSQEDWTGNDMIRVTLNDNAITGDLDIGTGETKEHPPMAADNTFAVPAVIRFYEVDPLDPNDLLAEHTITADDISAGTVTIHGASGGASYTFVLQLSQGI
jgi:hypothetical protein